MKKVHLSENEIAVMTRLTASNHKIATELGLKKRTVESIIENLFRKLNATNRVELALKGVMYGIIPVPSEYCNCSCHYNHI